MPRASAIEKSPVATEDYEGLQVDSRLKPDKSPYGFHYDDFDYMNFHEKESTGGVVTLVRAGKGEPISPETAYGYGSPTLGPGSPQWTHQTRQSARKSGGTDSTVTKERDRRICGLHRSTFWLGLVVVVLLLVGGAVVGGIFGGMKARQNSASNSSPSQTNNAPSDPLFPEAQPGDAMIGSPLCVISYDLGGSSEPAKHQEFRLYYQSLLGNVKEAVSSGSSSWQSAQPILTDALNNTGLASITYLNGTRQQGSIFYVGNNGLLQEKRKIYSDSQYWQPGQLNSQNVPMVGNISLPTQGDDPQDGWHSYSMAAVYSYNFTTGPGARLFYHAQQTDGSSFVQEMIWIQNNDTWTEGATITGAYPNSHLAATIDDKLGILRLFYASGNNTLQEAWMSVSEPRAGYKKGLRINNFLSNNAADLAAVSQNGTTYLYHYTSARQATPNNVGIHELTVSGNPRNNQESFNQSEPIVASPNLPSGNNASLYQPIAASRTVVPGLKNQQLFVIWADKPTGDPNTNATGYQQLSQISRTTQNTTWPDDGGAGTLQIPLGSANSDPH